MARKVTSSAPPTLGPGVVRPSIPTPGRLVAGGSLLLLVVALVGAAEPPTEVDRAAMGADVHAGPVLHHRLSDGVARKLSLAIPVALERIREHGSCQALFARLGADGATTIERTLYYPITREQERRYCRNDTHAITTVGGSVVKPCPSFARLHTGEAAMLLIHEALHNAGQTEYPTDPEAADSQDTTLTVMRSCRF